MSCLFFLFFILQDEPFLVENMVDPVEGNLFDLPDYEHLQDESFQPLPPPDSPGGVDIEDDLVNGGECSDLEP